MARNGNCTSTRNEGQLFSMDIKDFNFAALSKISAKYALIYLAMGLLWIVFSDKVLEFIVPNLEIYSFLQTIKGFFYVGLTAIFLYFRILNSLKKTKKVTQELLKNHEELNTTYQELLAAEKDLRYYYKELKLVKELLEKSEKRYKLAIEGANEGIWDYDFINDEINLSPWWRINFGYTQDTVKDPLELFKELIHMDDQEQGLRALNDYLKQNTQNFKSVFRMKTQNGKYKWILNKGKAIWDKRGNPLRMVGSSTDITEEKEMEKEIHRLAYYDNLTDLPNKHYLKKELEIYLKNDTEQKFAILYLGIDDFRTINSLKGYCYGDKILKVISGKLLEYSKHVDFICRYSGDEFILVSQLSNRDSLKKLAKSILQAIELLWYKEPIDYYLNASLGIAICPEHGKDFNALITNANSAMHAVKSKGGKSFGFYSEEIYLQRLEFVMKENDLRKAISNQEFILYYQPKIDLRTNSVIGAEALIRWRHPIKGLIPPAQFIAMAEQSGLIKDIDTWVINEVCRQIGIWNHKGHEQIKLSVNISPVEFRQKNLIAKLEKLFLETKIDTKFIEFEITENAFIENIKESIEIIKSMKELGVRIALDDFGTGYSSLSYLRELPIDILKIDKSFMKDLSYKKNKMLIKSIIDLSHNMGLQVVAEGIETKEVAEYLKELNCDIGQGYYFYKPMPASQLGEITL
jgi:diguanylate cyclase (GGDEF)-like protein/PAS domain S-box-containing protein